MYPNPRRWIAMPATAEDGGTEFNQALIDQGLGCPLTISSSGTYRPTSNLTCTSGSAGIKIFSDLLFVHNNIPNTPNRPPPPKAAGTAIARQAARISI